MSSPPHPCLLLTRTSAPASHQRAADGALPACTLPAPWAARSSCSTVSPVSCTRDDDATPRGTRFLSSCHSVQGAVSSQAPDNSLHCGPAHIPHVHQDGRRRRGTGTSTQTPRKPTVSHLLRDATSPRAASADPQTSFNLPVGTVTGDLFLGQSGKGRLKPGEEVDEDRCPTAAWSRWCPVLGPRGASCQGGSSWTSS